VTPQQRRGPVRRAWKRGRDRLLDHLGLLYGERFFAKSERHKGDSATPVAKALVERFAPASVVDVGCGSGCFLAPFAERGVPALGLDRSAAGLRRCAAAGVSARRFDLRVDPPPPERFDLCLCFEVAEHLPPQYADRLVTLVAALAPVAVFTAAPPGQGGVGHFNEQPPSYWIDRFARHGRRLREDDTVALRAAWQRAGVVSWLVSNVMVFGEPGEV
jgi:SAM-dependent methyltransferase